MTARVLAWRETYKKHRKRCRQPLSTLAILFYVSLISAPIISANGSMPPQQDGRVFGLDPELVKGAFYLLVLIVGGVLTRAIVKVDRNQSVLFDNQRKLAQWLTSLTTAHNINHGQSIQIPELSDSDRG